MNPKIVEPIQSKPRKYPDTIDEYPVAYILKKAVQICPKCANETSDVILLYKLMWYENSTERCKKCNRSLK